MRHPWHEREAVSLTNGVIRATLLLRGGHLAAFGFAGSSLEQATNTLWEAPYRTLDPDSPGFDGLAQQYGGGAAGRFLASFTGHALCLDQFGMPTGAEEAAGVGLHGEASLAAWEIAAQEDRAALCLVASLPLAGLTIERQFEMKTGESVLRVRESVQNVKSAERTFHWVQHVTLGPPFLDSNASSISASVDRGAVWPLGYESCELLISDAVFDWPFAPRYPRDEAHSMVDLRKPFASAGTGLVAAACQQMREIGFVAALNWELGLAMGYCFRRVDYPWLTIWEENGARQYPPWGGATQARGLEFGTTPFPLGRDETSRRGPLFGRPTERTIVPDTRLTAPWIQFVAAVPNDWRDILDIEVCDDNLTLVEREGGSVTIPARAVRSFLTQADEPAPVRTTR